MQEQLYKEHYTTVYAYLLSLCGDPFLAEDIASETFLRALKHIDSYNPRYAPTTWLCTIAKNLLYSHYKKEKRHLPLEEHLPIESITVMVQKEAAERLCAEVGSRAAGAVTVAVRYYAKGEILFSVPSGSFMPPPKVDSAVIKLNICDTPPVSVKDEKRFFSLVKAAFAQRRKTLCNTVSNTLKVEKSVLQNALSEMGLEPTVRGEALTMEQLAELSDRLW